MTVNIEIEEYDYQKVYYLSTPSNNPKLPLWLTADLSLTRVRSQRAFIRDIGKAKKLAGLIFAGEIREGVRYKK